MASPLLVTTNVARYRHAPVQSLENLIEHADMAPDDLATVQDAAVARRDRFDIALVENIPDAGPDGVGRRPLQPPIARVQQKRSQLGRGRIVVVGDDPWYVRPGAPDMGEHVRAEQRPRRLIIE